MKKEKRRTNEAAYPCARQPDDLPQPSHNARRPQQPPPILPHPRRSSFARAVAALHYVLRIKGASRDCPFGFAPESGDPAFFRSSNLPAFCGQGISRCAFARGSSPPAGSTAPAAPARARQGAAEPRPLPVLACAALRPGPPTPKQPLCAALRCKAGAGRGGNSRRFFSRLPPPLLKCKTNPLHQ